MVPLARRNLLSDRLRLALSVGGVALSMMLVLLLGGFLTGMYRQITAYIDNTPADFYVAQKGVVTLQGRARSSLYRCEGKELSTLPEGRLPALRLRHFGFIFQNFNLLSALSIRENVAVVLNLAGIGGRQAQVRAEAFLRGLDLGDRLDFRPNQRYGICGVVAGDYGCPAGQP